jgi:hypothetical protein
VLQTSVFDRQRDGRLVLCSIICSPLDRSYSATSQGAVDMTVNPRLNIRVGFLTSVIALAVLLLLGAPAGAGVKVAGDDETYVKIGGLLQAHAAVIEEGAPDGSSVGTEFYLRRMRLMVYGQFTEWVNYFVETDNPNFGKNGDLSMNMFIQDAYLEVNLHEAFQIDFGMLLVPFSHHGMQGATSLLALDYHGALLKYPDGSNKVWRDYGVMFRGLLVGGVFEYRLGVFNGAHGDSSITEYGEDPWLGQADPRNPMDLPRITARVTFNLFEPEGGDRRPGRLHGGDRRAQLLDVRPLGQLQAAGGRLQGRRGRLGRCRNAAGPVAVLGLNPRRGRSGIPGR